MNSIQFNLEITIFDCNSYWKNLPFCSQSFVVETKNKGRENR